MSIEYSHYGEPSQSPYLVGTPYPAGDTVNGDTEIQIIIGDDDEDLVLTSIDISVTMDPGGLDITWDAIVNGVFQEGWSGSITSNEHGGADVIIDTHARFIDNTFSVDYYCEDELSLSLSGDFSFDVATTPTLLSAAAYSRRAIELIFDIPVRVRAKTTLIIPPEDPHEVLDWVGYGGQSGDAVNPDNYTITRPEGGNLNEPGEAVDLTATYGEEHPEYTEVSICGCVVSSRIIVHCDFHHTARADYRIHVEGIRFETGPPMTPADQDFVGYIVSQVPRSTLWIWESLAEIHRRDDRDGTGDLKAFLDLLKEVYLRLLEDIDAFFWELCDIDRIRPEFLGNLLYDLGNPFFDKFDLTVNQQRKLAATLVGMYREKGTCIGIINAVRFFVGVNLSACKAPWDNTWRMHTGSYPSTIPGTGGPYRVGVNTRVGPGTTAHIWSFWLVSPVTLTVEQRVQISVVAEYMKPAGTKYLGIIEP